MIRETETLIAAVKKMYPVALFLKTDTFRMDRHFIPKKPWWK